ncbi:MAG: PAS domain S-box protein [Actinomycetota bacterium]
MPKDTSKPRVARPVPPVEGIAAVEEAQAWLAAIVESSDDAIIGGAPDKMVLTWNAAAERLYGYTAAEMIGRSIAVLVPPDRQDEVVDIMNRARRGETTKRLRTVRVRKDGKLVDVSLTVSPIKDSMGAVVAASITARDITEFAAAARAPQESEERYPRIVEAANEAVWTIDANSNTVSVSAEMADMLGYTPEEMIGVPLFRFMDKDDRAIAVGNVERRRRGIAEQHEFKFRRKDGSALWVLLGARPLTDAAGEYAGAVAVVADITQLKRADEAPRQALERERESADRLRALDETKNMFLRAVSHDLRTPLTAIRGLAETLKLHGARLSHEDAVRLTERILANAVRMERMTNNLLDFDSLSRGELAPDRRPVDIGSLVREAVAGTDPEGRPIEVEVEEEALIARVDRDQVERIIDNLLGNAVRYSPPETPIWIRLCRRDGGVLIAVEDSGPGVPDHLKEAVFDLFRRGEDVRPKGAGIGLSVVARFAELHGGRAWVEDRPGGGASFRVLLPEA